MKIFIGHEEIEDAILEFLKDRLPSLKDRPLRVNLTDSNDEWTGSIEIEVGGG